MDKTRKIIKSPSVKRRSRITPINQRVTLERVLGLTSASNASFACDPNSGTIAYTAGCVVVLINKGKQSHILNFSKKTLTSLAFSPDGKHIVTGESGHHPAVRVWNVEEKSQVSELHGHKFGINCVAFSPNLKYLVSVGSQHDMIVNVWNWRTATKVASNKISSKVNAVDFSEDGSMFVTVGNRHVKFWYLDSSKSRINETVPLQGRSGILGAQKNNFFCDVVCGKGRMSKSVFSITQSGLLCEFNEKRLLDKWAELRTPSASCLSAGEDHIFVGCANGVVRVFSGRNLHFLVSLPRPHHLGVDVASVLSPSQILPSKEGSKFPDTIGLVYDDAHKKTTCIYNDHSVYVWDVHDVKKVGIVRSFMYHSSSILGLEVAPPVQDGETPVLPPGTFITCSTDDTIRIWNLENHMTETKCYKRNVFSNELLKICYIDPSMMSLRDVDYNPAGGTDKTDTNYDGKNGIRSLCISPDGQHLASGDRIGNVRIHDLQTMQEIHSIEAHNGEVLCLEYSHVSTGPKLLSSTSRDRLVHVFDPEQRYGLLQTLNDHSASVTAVKFVDTDSQLKMLSCGADKSLLFRNAQMSPDFQFSLNQHLVAKTTLYDMAVDPTQKFLATACQDRNIRIYNIKTAKQKKHYKGSLGDDGTLTKVQLDPSGIYAATSCTDKNLCILDFWTGELMATMYGHSELATGIKFTHDLKHFISVSGDGCIFVWRLSGEMSRQMQDRLEELGQLPEEALGNSMNRTVTIDNPKQKEVEFKTPTSILAELTRQMEEVRADSPPEKPSLDYRFSVGQLPSWAKSKGDKSKDGKSGEDQSSNLPKGRWAQRVDNKGIMAQLDGKTVELDVGTDCNTRKAAFDDVDARRETMVVSQPENTPRKIPVIFDDENDDEDEDDDDEDFFPSFHKKKLWDESPRFTRRNSVDDLDDDLDKEPEVRYYPPSEVDSVESNGSFFTVFGGEKGKNSSQFSGLEKGLDADSESTDPISMEDTEEDDDAISIPSNPTTPSEDYNLRTPDREKFLKDRFENLNFTPTVSIDKFQERLDELESNIVDDSQPQVPGNSRISISTRFLSRAQQANIKNMVVYNSIQRQDNWFDLVMKGLLSLRLYHSLRRVKSVQKRKDEMARAVDETRKRLLAMGWNDKTSPETEQPGKDNLPSPPVKLPTEPEAADMFEDLLQQTTPTNKSSSPLNTPSSNSGVVSYYRATIWDSRSSTSEDSNDQKTPTNKTHSSPRRSRPSTLTLEREKKRREISVEVPTKGGDKKGTPRSQSHSSLYRQTESSKAKKSMGSSNNLAQQDRPTPKHSTNLTKSTSMTNLNSGERLTLPRSKPRMEAKKLSSLYTSTPNLAQSVDKNHDCDDVPSKLQIRTDICLSDSDLLDEDLPKTSSKKGSHTRASTTSKPQTDAKRSSIGAGVPKKESVRSSSATRAGRLSLPASPAVSVDSKTLKKSSVLRDDKDLMPPPSKGVITKGKQDTFVRRAAQSNSRKGMSELTLAQAKDILLGKSGILGSNSRSSSSNSASTITTTSSSTKLSHAKSTTKSPIRSTASSSKSSSHSTVSTGKKSLHSSTFPTYTVASTSSVCATSSAMTTVSSSSSSSSSVTSSATSSSSSPRSLQKEAAHLQITSEIETTAAEIRSKNMMEAAFQNLSVLDASPNDLPERDCSPQQPSGSSAHTKSPTMSGTNVTPTPKWRDLCSENVNGDDVTNSTRDVSGYVSHSSGVEEEEESLAHASSIKERIAMLHSHSSPQSSPRSTSTAHITLTPNKSPGPSVAKSGSPVSSTLSPRSSSGIGSSLDSDVASKLFASPGSSLSPHSNYHIAYDISDSDEGSEKSPPQDTTVQSSSFSSELDFGGKRLSLSKALEAVSGGHSNSRDSPTSITSLTSSNLPDSSTPTNLNSNLQSDWPTSSTRSTPSSIISNRSTLNGSPNVANGFTPISPRKQDYLQLCLDAVKELRLSVNKVSDLYDQVHLNSDNQSNEAESVLVEAVRENKQTFIDILSQTCDKEDFSRSNTEPVTIPREVLEPMLSSFGNQLLERFERLVTQKLQAEKQ
ncbi:mitogen-activated protein kinase-binding protein 1-like isoform X2 [Mizuhopecten yessoensis]|uniref:mitogen-activated protein kinase-binding protein 1-like isoform X2 n=1 Tax=Mizuhopecten yessoensis TaxID=6573 RepID=UPI000B458544|nr:mitogen-activated protein kinase-binding protein 1-like isoform X2 [Mizuhopecten yessoensis]